MNTNGRELKHRELTQKIIGVFYQVYNELLNYLRATHIEVGLLLNFGIKPEFKRLVFDILEKRVA